MGNRGALSMGGRGRTGALSLSTLACAIQVASAQQATFEILSARGGIREHEATSVSADGTIVGGYAGPRDSLCVREAYVWDEV